MELEAAMSRRDEYPATASEELREGMKYRAGALAAVRRLRRAGAWRGDDAVRFARYVRCVEELAAVYGMRTPRVIRGGRKTGCSGDSWYSPMGHAICLRGRLSVVTMLHEFAHARGYGERRAVRWSVNLFRRVFPRSFERCREVGHVLVAR
jgi:hypothetical protein